MKSTAHSAGARLADKVALITGIGGGQGREAALRFAAEGAIVVGCDIDVGAAAETLDAVHRDVGIQARLAHRVECLGRRADVDVTANDDGALGSEA